MEASDTAGDFGLEGGCRTDRSYRVVDLRNLALHRHGLGWVPALRYLFPWSHSSSLLLYCCLSAHLDIRYEYHYLDRFGSLALDQ